MATPIPANDAVFTVAEIAAATSGTVRFGVDDSEARGVVIDSRAVTPGCVFVAIRGERHDAHRFVRDAVTQGASVVLVEEGAGVGADLGAAVIEVPSTTRALGDLARAHRDRWPGVLVAVTGSAGKTTTKELTAAALAGTGANVHKTRGNLNNLFGVPMTLFELDPAHDAAVIETGTSRPGEIARLAEIARPDVAVVTLVAAAHTEGLGSVEAVATEKWSLVASLGKGGIAVVNGDDPSLRRLARDRTARTIFYGRDELSEVRLVSHEVGPDLRTHARIAIRGGLTLELELALVGAAAALNAAAALAVTVALGRDVDAAGRALGSVLPERGRMYPLRASRGALILDDSYNANPRSVTLALDTAADIARRRGGSAIAVLGDMKELGARSVDEHAAVGRHAAQAGIRLLAACGREMRHAAWSARRESPTMEVHHFDQPAEAVARIAEEAGRNDVVVVKGSRSMHMEEVVDALADRGAEEAS